MGENEKQTEVQKCCCCRCWARILITIILLAIGAVIGHVMTMSHLCGHHHGHHMMMGRCCGWGGDKGECRERGEREFEDGRFEHKFRCAEGWGERGEKGWYERKGDMEKHGPDCMCPMCTKMRAACASEPNKASCPMMNKDKKK
jgi:hypothetical protein